MVKAKPVPAPGEDASTALSLVNTRIDGPHGAVELLDDAPELSEWLRRVVSASTADARPADLRVVLELRSAVRTLFAPVAEEGHRETSALMTVNRIAAADPGAPQLISTGMPATVRWHGSGSNSVSTALASVARDAIAVLAAGVSIRECAASDCNRMFIPDHGRRIWCSTSCGNRARGLRHYRRLREIRARAAPAAASVPAPQRGEPS